jgi:hypothetical protein
MLIPVHTEHISKSPTGTLWPLYVACATALCCTPRLISMYIRSIHHISYCCYCLLYAIKTAWVLCSVSNVSICQLFIIGFMPQYIRVLLFTKVLHALILTT